MIEIARRVYERPLTKTIYAFELLAPTWPALGTKSTVLLQLVMLDTVTIILLARPLSKTVAVVAISMLSSDETCICQF